MNWRRLLLCLCVTGCLLAAYATTPFYAMWTLREAIKSGNTSVIDNRVAWPTVRATLKESLAKEANLLPMAEAAGGQVKPTMWQRIKGAFGSSMLDRFIETYVTPEGLPKLFDYRRTWNEALTNEIEEPAVESTLERIKRMWSRVERAEFQSLTRIEVEMRDRRVADRHYVSVMELEGLTWRLTALRVINPSQTGKLAEMEPAPSAR